MDIPLPIKSPDDAVSDALAQVHAYWRALGRGRIGPARAEIAPQGLRGLTARVWMMDALDGGADFRFRFAGDRIIEFMGRRYAGELLSAYRGRPFFDGMHALLAACMRERRAMALGPIPSMLEGREYLEFEVLVMPLSDDGTSVNIVFGAMETWPLGANAAAG